MYAENDSFESGAFGAGKGTYGVEIGVLAGVLDLYDILAGGRPDGGRADIAGGWGAGAGDGDTGLPLYASKIFFTIVRSVRKENYNTHGE